MAWQDGVLLLASVLCLLSVLRAAPQFSGTPADVPGCDQDLAVENPYVRHAPKGHGYTFKFYDDNGTFRHEEASLGSDYSLVVQGVVTWLGQDDGERYVLHYQADSKGYKAEGSHLDRSTQLANKLPVSYGPCATSSQ